MEYCFSKSVSSNSILSFWAFCLRQFENNVQIPRTRFLLNKLPIFHPVRWIIWYTLCMYKERGLWNMATSTYNDLWFLHIITSLCDGFEDIRMMLCANPLQWCHLSIMASQITSNSTVCSTVCSGLHQRKHQSSLLLAVSEGKPLVTGGFPSQRASNMEKVFMLGHDHAMIIKVPINTFQFLLQILIQHKMCL